ncbi:hypothetical protein [Magnetospirillum gryphiswaldense]|uniref:Secreted protein n=1 Tax=Magnetospirillum gryphiswaldense TaxID=55518 RepID=A4U051_9PROT|nr:hypothetical protein [Magnetospirillum gryphiswaldense]AVM75307.1 hypothetical protein MSR1_28390 [Magnetospirillum gryphiswaldense MSR-1]AVM79210.1 hypothetical protein MSR1L_28390 [Magnetospirillum gryphiswaldense]CAM76258.1 conserved hypothetical protein, secreted [Magnetospirillum gryphiswaldense MSR-1]
MRVLIRALVLLFIALPAQAEDGGFDLGFARPGMEQAHFRDSHQEGGGRVLCSNDPGLPADLDLKPPKGVARVGAVRCGFYAQDQSAHWHPAPLSVAGWPGEMWAVFLPDQTGTQRLVQIKLVLPSGAFDDLARSWDRMFGLPSFRRGQTVHWTSDRNDAAIIGDGGAKVHAYVMDNDLHSSANRRLGQLPAKH